MNEVVKIPDRKRGFCISAAWNAMFDATPRMTNALTVDTKVKEGKMTSSPGWISSRNAIISSAWVQEVVNKAFSTPRFSSNQV